MTKKLSMLLIFLIFISGLTLRFYKLGQIPPALDWDEASLGYNAYTLLNSGKDEYGNNWPISIRSFNDYKASFYVYLSLVPVMIFGLSEFSVRFISALFGSLTILLTYLLFKKITQLEVLGLLTALLLAVSPWHLQFSRVAFEANLALFFFITGAYFLILSLKKNIYLPLSLFFFGVSMFIYHSTKIVVPVFIAGILCFYRKELFKKKLSIFLSAIIISTFILLFFYSFRLGGSARFSSTAGLNQGTLGDIFKRTVSAYLSHYDFNFLFILGDPQTRHHPLGLAQLYLWELPFVVLGIVFLIKNKFKYNAKYYTREKRPQYNFFIFWWFLTAPIASALTKDVPNAVRSLLFLPTFQFFTSYGLLSIYQATKKRILKISFIVLSFAFCVLSFFYYLHMYFYHGPRESSQAWLYGYREVVDYVNNNGNRYAKIIITTAYDQPYIYFLFYQRPLKVMINNGEFSKGFANLEFRPINWYEDNQLEDILLIGTAEEIPDNSKVVETIYFLDGKIAFKIASL